MCLGGRYTVFFCACEGIFTYAKPEIFHILYQGKNPPCYPKGGGACDIPLCDNAGRVYEDTGKRERDVCGCERSRML